MSHADLLTSSYSVIHFRQRLAGKTRLSQETAATLRRKLLFKRTPLWHDMQILFFFPYANTNINTISVLLNNISVLINCIRCLGLVTSLQEAPKMSQDILTRLQLQDGARVMNRLIIS